MTEKKEKLFSDSQEGMLSIRSFRVGSEQKKESELNIEMEPRKFNGQKKETEQKKKDSAWTTCRQNPLFRGGVIRLRLERRINA